MASSQTDLSVLSLFNVKDKIALVSGGGSGIGLMIASALVQNGAKVYIASRKEKQLKEVSFYYIKQIRIALTSCGEWAQEALNKQGPGRCEYIVADLGVSSRLTTGHNVA
jgi:NAD(P)-dependent dehydrogenase (short-subunit alcohol dehydrogenase family)